MRKLMIPFVLALSALGQAQTAKPQSSATTHKPAAATKSDVDMVIDLVKGGMSEALVIKTLQRQGTAYSLSPADLVKLQKAGVSENIINVMMDPKASVAPPTAAAALPPATSTPSDTQPGGAGPAPASARPADAGVVTPFPPDIQAAPVARKRRVVVAVFDYGAQKDPAQAAYNPWALWYAQQMGGSPQTVADDVGKGIRAMLMTRLQQSNVVTVLERNPAIDIEMKGALTARTDQSKRPKMGRTMGADCVVTGDITIFGRDDKTKTTGGGGGGVGIPKVPIILGGARLKKKEDNAVVAIEFRIVDAETSEVFVTASARGVSTRKSKSLDFGGLGIGQGGAAGGGFQNAMTSSGFEKTILGEATIDAVDKIVKQLEEKIPQLPAKPRSLEGRVATIIPNGAYLALGGNDGVLLGDRFEIMQINGEVLDPETHDVIDRETVKVGELVVNDVRDKAAIGNYGGQPLSPSQLGGKGYLARLMSK